MLKTLGKPTTIASTVLVLIDKMAKEQRPYTPRRGDKAKA
jgi:hypothetical protein